MSSTSVGRTQPVGRLRKPMRNHFGEIIHIWRYEGDTHSTLADDGLGNHNAPADGPPERRALYGENAPPAQIARAQAEAAQALAEAEAQAAQALAEAQAQAALARAAAKEAAETKKKAAAAKKPKGKGKAKDAIIGSPKAKAPRARKAPKVKASTPTPETSKKTKAGGKAAEPSTGSKRRREDDGDETNQSTKEAAAPRPIKKAKVHPKWAALPPREGGRSRGAAPVIDTSTNLTTRQSRSKRARAQEEDGAPNTGPSGESNSKKARY